MTDEETKGLQCIKEGVGMMCYRDIYRKKVYERLSKNTSYQEIRNLYEGCAKGLLEILKIEDALPESASEFKGKHEVFKEILKYMRMLSDFECAELILVIREEYETGETTLGKMMKEAKEREDNAEHSAQAVT